MKDAKTQWSVSKEKNDFGLYEVANFKQMTKFRKLLLHTFKG